MLFLGQRKRVKINPFAVSYYITPSECERESESERERASKSESKSEYEYEYERERERNSERKGRESDCPTDLLPLRSSLLTFAFVSTYAC